MKFPDSLKLALVTGLTCFASLHAIAQKAYVKLGGGYNFGMGSEIMYQNPKNTILSFSHPFSTMRYEQLNVNHGKGGVFGGAFGYMFNNNIGFEVGVNYLAGDKSKFKFEEQRGSLGFGNLNSPLQGVSSMSSATETFTTKSQMVLVQPSLVIAAGLPKLNPYTRIGLVVAKGNLKNTYSYSESYGENMEAEEKYFGGIGFGLQAALGLNLSLNDKIGIYTEGSFNNLTYAPEKGEVTKYNRNGTDQMHTLQTSQKETNFEDDQTTTSNSSQPSSPGTGQKQSYTLNSVGLNVGLKFSF